MDPSYASQPEPALLRDSIDLWHRANGPWRGTEPRYIPREQRRREASYDRAFRDVQRISRSARRIDPHILKSRLVSSFAGFAAEALDLGEPSIQRLTTEFLPVGTQLTTWARRFDPTLSQNDITQACRNAWTACGLQPLFGAEIALSPGILAYSLLYPYSDNYIDQPSASRAEKQQFSDRFRSRLSGDVLLVRNLREAFIWELVRIIEDQFPRALYPAVYQSLLAIHHAQTTSVVQLDPTLSLGPAELLGISCAKGGTSVLADAFLVHGNLTPQQRSFAFLWGVLLQLGDDLQDIFEDLDRGSSTLFTRAILCRQPLDDLVSQLLNFATLVGVELEQLPHGDADFKALLQTSWRSLIVGAVAQTHQFFTPPFLRQMESCSAFRFGFLRARRKKLASESGLVQRLFTIASADPEPLPASLPDPTLSGRFALAGVETAA